MSTQRPPGVLPTLLVCILGLLYVPAFAQSTGEPAATNAVLPDAALSSDEALQKLMTGNQRFVHNAPIRPDQSPTRRTQLDFSQYPFACILSCSDSRVPPEVVFDQGLGNLFVVRVAGNILDKDGLGSLEYAVAKLHAPLILVLGHSRCGAVSAAVSGQPAPGHVAEIVDALKPAVRAVRDKPGDPVEQATRANIELVVDRLKTSKPVLADYVKTGRLKVVGGRYDLATGQVELLAQ